MRLPALALLVALALPAVTPDLAGAAVHAGPLGQGELTRLEAGLGVVLDAVDDGALDTNEAVAALFGATATSLAFVAAELSAELEGSAGALDAAQASYSEFAVAAQEQLQEAFAALGGLDVNVRVQKRFTPFLVGPLRPSGTTGDAGWLATAAWSSSHGSGVIGAGYGASRGDASGEVRLVGPGGRDETLVLPFEPSPRQDLFRLITPRIVSDAPSLAPLPGDWRLELRGETDEPASDIVQITLP